jgi:alkanesulfonate monooxygenase SsuD/methylene tetrahydromethanopterin reductase-like flavin-dependent oxidoreductase (luciferase family)
MVVAQAYAAAHTQRVHFGPLVAPFSFRDPVLLARQAAALDDLSGGRMILGVGAGWMEREHTMFGYPLGSKRARLDRFEEGLEVLRLLLTADPPVNFQGNCFNLRDAEIRPRTGATRILVGGNGRLRTMRLAARYAAVWNGLNLSPAEFQERSGLLADYERDAGRELGAIKRTLSVFFFFGVDDSALERRLAYVRTWNAELAALPLEKMSARFGDGAIVGSTEAAVEKLRAFKAAGVQEIMLQWFAPADAEGIAEAAETILPKI